VLVVLNTRWVIKPSVNKVLCKVMPTPCLELSSTTSKSLFSSEILTVKLPTLRSGSVTGVMNLKVGMKELKESWPTPLRRVLTVSSG